MSDQPAQKRGSTRLDGPRRTPSKNVKDRAFREVVRWLDGDIDGVDCRTTPQGERIVEPYNRADESER